MASPVPVSSMTASPNPAAAAAGANPKDDRFQTQLRDIQSKAAFGVYTPDVVKAASGGKTDWNRDILLTVRKEFFNIYQFTEGIYWAATVGMFVGALTVALLTPGGFPDLLGENAAMIWGVFLLSFGISSILSESGAHSGNRKCTRDKYTHANPKRGIKVGDYKVDEEYRGMECLDDWDCTRKSTVTPGVCAFPKPNKLFLTIRHVVSPISLLAGIVLTAVTFSSTDFRLAQKDLAQAIIYGLGMGTFFAILLS